MSSHATSSRNDESSTIRHRNVNQERATVLRIIESAERPRPRHHRKEWKDYYGIHEKLEVIAIILLLVATHILLALLAVLSSQLLEWMVAIFDLFVSWGDIILTYLSTWIQGMAIWKWLW